MGFNVPKFLKSSNTIAARQADSVVAVVDNISASSESSLTEKSALEKAWSSINSVELVLKSIYRIGLTNEWFGSDYALSNYGSESNFGSPISSPWASPILSQKQLPIDASVGIQCGPDKMAFYPKIKGPFATAIQNSQFKIIVKIESDIVLAIMDKIETLPNANEVIAIPIDSSTRIQIIDCISNLPRARKAQFAAFVRKEKCLVVWSDSSNDLCHRVDNLLDRMVNLVWSSSSVQKDNTYLSVVELQTDIEQQADKERPEQYLTTFSIAIAIVLLCSFVGLGARRLLIETLADGHYLRWAILATYPFTLTCASFFTLVIGSSCIKLFGPIKQMHTNSANFSAKAPRRMQKALPHITIQCPVYKESLVGVIEPTMASVRAAISTYELQGGTASIFVNDDGMQLLNDEEAKIRKSYYASTDIGWVARPPDGKDGFRRAGKFKKASNMNFALRISYELEQCLQAVVRDPSTWTEKDEINAYSQVLNQVLEANPQAWASGDIRIGDYILLIDSDTRVPKDCLLDAASEFEESPDLAVLQHVSGVMMVVNNFWEECIAHFTRLVYQAIQYGCAAGDCAPFVGHNAFLRWSALQEIMVNEDGVKSWWSESHVSEDFEMSLKVRSIGYSLRLAAYSEFEFKEGVSLTVYDEITRWQKYAYGCSELVFHPFKNWFTRGPFTPLFRQFLGSKIPWVHKFTILAYIFSYYAIASSWVLTGANYFLTGWFASSLDQFYVSGWSVMLACLVVFSAVGPLVQSVVSHRAKQGHFMRELVTNYTWTVLLSIFLCGLSVHISMALLCHMLSINMTWSATAKELENSNFWLEVPKIAKRFKWMYLGLVIAIAGMIILSTSLIPVGWRITGFFPTVPLAIIVACHFAIPLLLNPQLMAFSF